MELNRVEVATNRLQHEHTSEGQNGVLLKLTQPYDSNLYLGHLLEAHQDIVKCILGVGHDGCPVFGIVLSKAKK